MSAYPDFKMQLVSALRGKDVELSEDLYRRMSPCGTIQELNNYFHGLLAQYSGRSMSVRGTLVATSETTFEEWFVSFNQNVLPFISRKRLPPCTDTAASPIYQCESKDSIL